MKALLISFLFQLQLPAPRGFVNDFAGVLDPAAVSRMDSLIAEVRTKTRGEIAVVTLADLGGREAADVAVQIGREWGVGARGAAGDAARNLGVVILLVPLRDHLPGTGRVFIATGRGAEGFLTDARVGRVRDAMIPYLAREDFGTGLLVSVELVAQAFAEEFGVTLGGPIPPRERQMPAPSPPGVVFFALFLVVTVMVIAFLAVALVRGPHYRRRRGRRWIWVGGWGAGWGGGWSGGGGGFSGGFGGGGGFSGGGAGGRF